MKKPQQQPQHVEMNETKNDIAPETRQRVVDLLNQRVADAADLFYALRTAHFNVKGPSFGSLHELFEKIYTYVDEAVDEMAERAVQLGGQMHSTLRQMVGRSQLEDYPTDLRAGLDHCEAVADRLSHFGRLVRESIDETDEAGDADTADLLTDISREIDKFTWMVEAHLQADR